jgi:hypothetical protein
MRVTETPCVAAGGARPSLVRAGGSSHGRLPQMLPPVARPPQPFFCCAAPRLPIWSGRRTDLQDILSICWCQRGGGGGAAGGGRALCLTVVLWRRARGVGRFLRGRGHGCGSRAVLGRAGDGGTGARAGGKVRGRGAGARGRSGAERQAARVGRARGGNGQGAATGTGAETGTGRQRARGGCGHGMGASRGRGVRRPHRLHRRGRRSERAMGFEPTTLSLEGPRRASDGRRRSLFFNDLRDSTPASVSPRQGVLTQILAQSQGCCFASRPRALSSRAANLPTRAPEALAAPRTAPVSLFAFTHPRRGTTRRSGQSVATSHYSQAEV